MAYTVHVLLFIYLFIYSRFLGDFKQNFQVFWKYFCMFFCIARIYYNEQNIFSGKIKEEEFKWGNCSNLPSFMVPVHVHISQNSVLTLK